MGATVYDPMVAEGGVIYFHGASSERDRGPSDLDVEAVGVDLVRHVRPGYDGSRARPEFDLQAVAASAIDEFASVVGPLVLMGWSGGGPYALAGGALRHPDVRGVCLLGAWASMDPPDRGLPFGVRLFMGLGRHAPRSIVRLSLVAVGFRNPGHADDVRRVARPWGFRSEDVAAEMPVAVWHAEGDAEAPIGPWTQDPTIELHRTPGCSHQPSPETWRAALEWSKGLLS